MTCVTSSHSFGRIISCVEIQRMGYTLEQMLM